MWKFQFIKECIWTVEACTECLYQTANSIVNIINFMGTMYYTNTLLKLEWAKCNEILYSPQTQFLFYSNLLMKSHTLLRIVANITN